MSNGRRMAVYGPSLIGAVPMTADFMQGVSADGLCEWAVNHDLPVQSSVTVVTPSGFYNSGLKHRHSSSPFQPIGTPKQEHGSAKIRPFGSRRTGAHTSRAL
jgi:hypothetical protein